MTNNDKWYDVYTIICIKNYETLNVGSSTQKYLPDAFEVLKAWGFKYCQTLTWCKTPSTPKYFD